MPTSRHLCLLTGLLPGLAVHLPETAAGMRTARERLAARGWEVTWIVVVDGPGSVGVQEWPTGTIVEHSPVHGGIAAARNRALHRAFDLAPDGWVYPLDGDDVLDVDGLSALLADPALEEAGNGWVSANRAFLDGTSSRHHRATPRRWARHELAGAWSLPVYPFMPNAVLARTGVALAAGGWPAVIVAEDFGWALALSEQSAGASTPHVVTRYRAWPGQTTGTTWFDREFLAAYALITSMANARREALGQPTVRFPVPPDTGVAESTAHRTRPVSP
ncbi:hypothetical protein [Streptomyces sp. NPDC051567]|uniref:hypothetical protein n=1 Tax=Streptomyces sp. NPDC051567 TaxID=3365660 RepID=UPI00378ACE88